MSWYEFLASDVPMNDVENPRVQWISLREALERGKPVPEWVRESIDLDKAGTVLWFESEEDLHEIEITKIDRHMYTDEAGIFPHVDLPYFSSLEWRYTEERAARLIDYIREHLSKASVVELWGYWDGFETDKSKSRRREITADALTPEYLASLRVENPYDYDCIVIRP
ncbi:MAG: hypothetical protein LBS19_00435 [Clostridiales bacterium]|jgi:hypothetical protein|nr:hypothetical protein [Clostridiales bacterium]